MADLYWHLLEIVHDRNYFKFSLLVDKIADDCEKKEAASGAGYNIKKKKFFTPSTQLRHNISIRKYLSHNYYSIRMPDTSCHRFNSWNSGWPLIYAVFYHVSHFSLRALLDPVQLILYLITLVKINRYSAFFHFAIINKISRDKCLEIFTARCRLSHLAGLLLYTPNERENNKWKKKGREKKSVQDGRERDSSRQYDDEFHPSQP